MNDTLFNPAIPVGLPDGGELGSMTLETHINGKSFNLIYRAHYEVFDHTGSKLARELVSFAKQHDCGYALLVDGCCWVAENRGLSITAQLENHKAFKHYDMIVLPLDEMVYMAFMDKGLLQQEKVYPINKALEVLLPLADTQRLAILAGGMAMSQLQQAGLEVNCSETLVTHAKEAKPYTYQPLSLLLLQHRLYHHRLLLQASILMAVLLGLGLLFHYFTLEEVKEVVEQKVEQVQEVVTAIPPDYANNHASQVLLQLDPWLKAPWLDFLTTCRLTNIRLRGTRLVYQGQWMDTLQGCGNFRLRQVVQEQQLQLTNHKDDWRITGAELPIEVTSLARPNTARTLQQLQQLAVYLGWKLTIKHTKRHGEASNIQVNLAGEHLNQYTLTLLAEHFSPLAARMEQAQLVFDPESLNIIKAELQITLFTTGEERL